MTDPLMSRLMTAMQSPSSGEEIAAIRQELFQRLASDPNPIRQVTARLILEDAEEEKPADDDRIQRARRRHLVIRKLKSDIRALRDRNTAFAAAVGACPICWGDDISCELCGGTGQPGNGVPDERLFELLVAPAVYATERRHRRPRDTPRTPEAKGPVVPRNHRETSKERAP